MSKSATVYTLMAALLKAVEVLGQKSRHWTSRNSEQEFFLTEFWEKFGDEAGKIKEIESIFSRNADDINRFLLELGFSISLNPFSSGEFGVAAVLDLLVEWLFTGECIYITTEDRKKYPGVHLKEGVRIWSAYGTHDEPIAEIETKSGHKVYMTMIDKVPDGLALILLAQKLTSQFHYSNKSEGFKGIHFPMVDFTNQPDISWLQGMSTTSNNGEPVWISQAVQETKLKMNEKGAHLTDAVAIGMKMCMMESPKPLIMDKPFLAIFKQPGLSVPLAVFHLEPDCWMNPGNL